eukprot:gene9793-10241_t
MRAAASLAALLSAHPAPLAAAAEDCDVAVVGAGPGGVYFAWRLLAERPGLRVRIFERSGRHGGRILTVRRQGPRADLTVDLGAYRFAAQPMEEGSIGYMYTPLTAAVIDGALRLRTARYDPGDANSTMRKIVDAAGENAGYATFVDAMFDAAQSGGAVPTFGDEVVRIAPNGTEGAVIHTRSGGAVRAQTVLLNLPQIPLLRLLRNSPEFSRAASPVLQVPIPNDGAKLYVHYDNAWWRNLLGLRSGQFSAGSFGATHTSSHSHRNVTTPNQLPLLLG